MFSLIRDKEGQLKLLTPDERFKIIDNKYVEILDDSYITILKSNNRFYLEQTKKQLLSKVNVEMVNADGTDENYEFDDDEYTSGKEIENKNKKVDLMKKSIIHEKIGLENDDQLGENRSSDDDDGDDDDDNSSQDDDLDKEYESSESELDVDSVVDSDDDFQDDSDDSFMEELRHNYPAVELPNISVSLISSEQLASSSLHQSTIDSVSESLLNDKDPEYVPDTSSNITAEGTNKENTDSENTNKENTDSENTNKEKQKEKENLINQVLNDNIEKHIDNAEPPDYEKIVIEPVEKKNENSTSPRKRKLHECVFCGIDQSHLKRHLLRKHKNEPAVQNMKKAAANLSSSRIPMKTLLYAGDVKHNSDITKFKGKYRVARNPRNAGKKVSDYSTCPKCKAVVLEFEFRKHITVCTGMSGRHCRNLKSLGNKFMNNCHARASTKMRKQILSRMRNDKVLRAIKNDALLVEYGNEICEHLRGNQHKTNICAKLRRLGRLKLAMKEKRFEDILVSGKSLTLVKVIERMAADPDDPDSDYLKFPTLAENLATLVKQVAKTHSVLCLRKNEEEVRKTTVHFLECFENDYRTRLSRMVSESHGKHKREKVVELPSSEDIRKLYNYLSKIRQANYNALQETFAESNYLDLLKSTLTSLQVFNSRRPGDVERIFLSEYEKRQQIGQEQRSDFQGLPGDIQDLANEFSLLQTRGKWSNNIKLLVPPDVSLCIQKLIELRPKMDISPKNGYLFALPKTPLVEIRHPSAYVLLSRYAEQCGAEKPHLLRSTRIRKNLATKCIELNLNDAELTDLAAYMGHHIDIHKSHYRRNIVSRDIPLFLKFVNKALETKKSEKTTCSESDEPEENNDDSVVERANNSATTTTEKSTNDANANENIAADNDILEDTNLQNSTAALTRSKKMIKKGLENKNSKISPKQVDRISRPRWSPTEIKIIFKEFKDYFDGSTDTVSSEKIRGMMAKNPTLFKGRTDKAIRTWINIRKKKNTN